MVFLGPRLIWRKADERGLLLAIVLDAGGGMERENVPYRVNSDLPPSVRKHLPEHAQDIYREAFNHAFAAHAGEPEQEQRAHRIAWAAVKRSYVKNGDTWVAR
jgi:cation transport regulator